MGMINDRPGEGVQAINGPLPVSFARSQYSPSAREHSAVPRLDMKANNFKGGRRRRIPLLDIHCLPLACARFHSHTLSYLHNAASTEGVTGVRMKILQILLIACLHGISPASSASAPDLSTIPECAVSPRTIFWARFDTHTWSSTARLLHHGHFQFLLRA